MMETLSLVYVVVPLMVFIGYVVFGISGFGASIVIVPVLAHLLPLKFLIPFLVLLDLAATVFMHHKNGMKGCDTAEVRSMLPFMLMGMALGVYLLTITPDRWIMLTLGLFVATYALIALVRHKSIGHISHWWRQPLALLGGVAGSLFGSGGPIYAIYVSRRLHDPTIMRATMSTLIAISVVLRAAMLLASGLLLQADLALAVLGCLGFMAAGVALGMRLHSVIKPIDFRRIVHLLLIISGSSLALRAALMSSS